MPHFAHLGAVGKTILPVGRSLLGWDMRILTVLCGCLLAWSVSAKQLHIGFGDMPPDSSPTNFHAAVAGEGSPARWKIVVAEVPSLFAPLPGNAPTVNHSGVLAPAADDMTDEHFPMFIYDGDSYRDFKATTRFKIISGIAEQMAGLVFRFQNNSNFYVVRVSSLGQNIRFYKVVNGVRSDPIGPMFKVPAGEWHTLGVQCDGNKINVFFDDRPVMPTLNDTSFNEGKVGFWTKSDALSYFADLTVDYTPRVPVAQSIINTLINQQPRILGLRIYALESENQANLTRVIASEITNEIGQLGTDAEMNAITNGSIFYGTDRGAVYVTLPLRDRNGEYIAAVWVKLKSYLTESQNAAVFRATMIRNKLEELSGSSDVVGR
jgi:hypothetical protein